MKKERKIQKIKLNLCKTRKQVLGLILTYFHDYLEILTKKGRYFFLY